MDIARILASLRTAHYQYIPALGVESGDAISLRLNTPPSFHNPKSVLVMALPAVKTPEMPPLHAVDPNEVYCAEKAELVLPAEGTPLVFSTHYAHDMVLRLRGKNGKVVDLPAKADPQEGGFVADTASLSPTNFGDTLDGSLHGYWGFETYNGPEFRLQNVQTQQWQLANENDQPLIAGQEGRVDLLAGGAACVDSITLRQAAGKVKKVQWKTIQLNEVEVTLPLKKSKPGPATLLIKQFGSKNTGEVPLNVYSQPGDLNHFELHAGDPEGTLTGTHLNKVSELAFAGVHFRPHGLMSSADKDQLTMVAADPSEAAALREGESATATVTLDDGRIETLNATIGSPRPSIAIISKNVVPVRGSQLHSARLQIQLDGENEIPQNALFAFSIRAIEPSVFPADIEVEVATSDGLFSKILSLAHGMILADSGVAVVRFKSSVIFGRSAFGPIQFRVIERGIKGDWQPLGTLVRLPSLHSIQCSAGHSKPCVLQGSNLFLIDTIMQNAQMEHAVRVRDGFTASTLLIPHPLHGKLYLALHDDPSEVNRLIVRRAKKRIHEQSIAGVDF